MRYEDFKNIYLIDEVADEDKFDHGDFAEILWRIITDNTKNKDKTPFNIGIFGKWGVGKSTVVHLFRKTLEASNLNKKNKQYKFIEFKVWKYSKNALKRKFIFTIGKELYGEQKLDDLNTEIRGKKTTTFPAIANPQYLAQQLVKWKENIDWGFVSIGGAGAILFISLSFLLHKVFNFGWVHSFSDLYSFVLTFVSCQIPTFIVYILHAIEKTKISYAFDAYDSEEQFEEKFIKLIQEDKEQIKVIFIDDLDRCNEEKVIETLETIKTYLDVKTCIFIIACDDEIIRNVVENKRSDVLSKGDAISYLNKFFQYTIRIPPFIHQNMEEYAKDILKFQKNDLLNLEDINEILYVLIHDEVKSPRKAISLINSFASDFEVTIKREESSKSKLRQGDISQNLPALAVFTVLKTDYPSFYEMLSSKDSKLLKYVLLIEEGNVDFIQEYHLDVLDKIYRIEGEGENRKIKRGVLCPDAHNFVKFIKRVDDIIRDVHDVNIFIYLDSDQSSYALESQRLRSLREHVRAGNLQDVTQMITDLKLDDEKINHFNVIKDSILQAKLKFEIKNGLQCLFQVIEHIPENTTLRWEISKIAISRLSEVTSQKAKLVEEFNLDGIFFASQFLDSDSRKQENILNLIEILEKTINKEYANKILRAIFKYRDLITSNATDRVTHVLMRRNKPAEGENVFFSFEEVCSLIVELKDNKKAVLKFFGNEVVNENIQRLLKVDSKKEKSTEEQKEAQYLKVAFEIADEALSIDESEIKRRTEVLTELLPTVEYYYVVIKKLNEIKDRIPTNMLYKLTLALSQEVESIPIEHLEESLDLIDKLSERISQKPIEALSPLTESLPKFMLAADEKTFSIPSKYIIRFADGRLGQAHTNLIFETLLTSFDIYGHPQVVPKVGNFILSNLTLVGQVVKDKLFDLFCDDIYRIETFDKTKFPTNDGIGYWASVSTQVILLATDINKLVSKIDLSTNILNEKQSKVSLLDKTILWEILEKNFIKYNQTSKEHLLKLIIQYLKSSKVENIEWGVSKLYKLSNLFNISGCSEVIQDEIIEDLCKNTDSVADEFKRQVAELLIDLRSQILLKESPNKGVLLEKVKWGIKSRINSFRIFDGFLALYKNYKVDDQVELCGDYLGSQNFSDENSGKLVDHIVEEFKKVILDAAVLSEAAAIAKTVVTVAEEVVPSLTGEAGVSSTIAVEVPSDEGSSKATVEVLDFQNPAVIFIEKHTVGISLDKKAWDFFDKICTALFPHYVLEVKKCLSKDNIKKLKSLEEAQGISRNRFTLIHSLKNSGAYKNSEISSMFCHLFTGESIEKITIAVDCLGIYYPDLSKLSREDKNLFKPSIKQASEKVSDDSLKERLIQLLNSF